MSIHIAGPIVDRVQYCARCGLALSDQRIVGVDIAEPADRVAPIGCGPYVVSSHVEYDESRGWQAVCLSASPADLCTPRSGYHTQISPRTPLTP